jgi:hypothetical protein
MVVFKIVKIIKMLFHKSIIHCFLCDKYQFTVYIAIFPTRKYISKLNIRLIHSTWVAFYIYYIYITYLVINTWFLHMQYTAYFTSGFTLSVSALEGWYINLQGWDGYQPRLRNPSIRNSFVFFRFSIQYSVFLGQTEIRSAQ